MNFNKGLKIGILCVLLLVFFSISVVSEVLILNDTDNITLGSDNSVVIISGDMNDSNGSGNVVVSLDSDNSTNSSLDIVQDTNNKTNNDVVVIGSDSEDKNITGDADIGENLTNGVNDNVENEVNDDVAEIDSAVDNVENTVADTQTGINANTSLKERVNGALNYARKIIYPVSLTQASMIVGALLLVWLIIYIYISRQKNDYYY